MTRLAVVRHAITEWNEKRRIQGRSDTTISPAGRAAAAKWEVPAEMRSWRRLCSPLRRTRQTAELLFGSVPPTDPRLIEMNYGEWEGRYLDELRAEMGARLSVLEERGLDFRAPGGESPRDVQDRLRPLLAEIAAAGQPTLAVTHKGVMRALYAAASGWDMTGEPPVALIDGCIHVFELDAAGNPAVESMNLPLEGPR